MKTEKETVFMRDQLRNFINTEIFRKICVNKEIWHDRLKMLNLVLEDE
jgi:hypothetical protein